jgi:putative tryptophan/tyrosine transport system substrate-binding protein
MFGRIILALTAMLLGHCFLADAQQAARVYRLGFVSSSSRDQSPRADAFRQGLQELGYVEGRNLVIEYRYAGAGAIGYRHSLPN